MKKLVFAILIGILLIGRNAFLDAEEASPQINVHNVTSYQGRSVTVYLSVQNFDEMGALNLKLFYDADALTLATHFAESFLGSSQTLVDEDSGVAQISIINPDGLSGSGRIYGFSFNISADTPPGEYPIFVAISEAFDVALDPVEIETSHGGVTVREVTTQQPQIYSSGSLSKSTLKEGDRMTYTVSLSSSVMLGAGTFELSYDHDKLQLINTTVGSQLATNNNYTTLNNSVRGLSRLTLISLDGLNRAIPFITYEFEAIADINGLTRIEWESTEVFNVDLNPIKGRKISQSLSLVQRSKETVNPKIYLPNQAISATSELSIPLKIEAGTSLGAATMVLRYNPYLLELTHVEAPAGSAGLLLHTIDADSGQLTLSYLNENGLENAADLANLTFKALPIDEPLQTELSLTVLSPIDDQYQPVQIDTLNAVFQISNNYQVRYKGPDDETLQEDNVQSISETTAPNPVELPGHRFSHWQQSVTGNQVTYHAQYYMPGDFDANDLVDSDDVMHVHEKIVNRQTLSTLEHKAMDMNQDGEVTLADIMLIELLIAGRLLDSDF